MGCILYFCHKFQFGDFVQATKPPKTNATGNNMDERVSDAIYCHPSGNVQGGFWIYQLSTAQVVHQNKAKLAHHSTTICMKDGESLPIYKDRRFIYAKAIKAIYGTLRVALLFCQLFSGELTKWGFVANQYDA